MSVDKQHTLSKIRTFAQDLKEHQEDTGQPAEQIATESKKGAAFETPKMAAPNTSKHSVTVEKRVSTQTTSKKKPLEDTPKAEEKIPSVTTTTPIKVPTVSESQDNPERQTTNKISSPKVKVRSKPKKGRRLTTTTTSIITDVKPASDSFFVRTSKALSTWLQSFKKRKRKTASQYVIEDTIRRKGVIQKATTKTGALFTADNETLREEIRKRRSHEKNPEVTKEPEITWTPNTESGYPLLEKPEVLESHIKNVQVAFKKKTVPPAPVLVEPTDTRWEDTTAPAVKVEPVAEVATPAPPEEIKIPVAVTETPTQEVTTPTQPTPAIPEREPLASSITTTPEESFPEPVVQKSSLFKDILQKRISFYDINTNTISIIAVAGIVFLVALILLVRSVFILLATEPSAPLLVESTPILAAATVTNTALAEISTEALLQAVSQNTVVMPGDLIEINFVTQTNEDVPAQTLIELFNFSTNTNLNRSITEIRLLRINQTDKAIIFTTTDDTTAFGALLTWEGTMASELAPFLETSTRATNARFIDKTIAGTDVRILLNEEDSEVLVYGFIDKGIVLIAQDTTAFTRIANNQ